MRTFVLIAAAIWMQLYKLLGKTRKNEKFSVLKIIQLHQEDQEHVVVILQVNIEVTGEENGQKTSFYCSSLSKIGTLASFSEALTLATSQFKLVRLSKPNIILHTRNFDAPLIVNNAYTFRKVKEQFNFNFNFNRRNLLTLFLYSYNSYKCVNLRIHIFMNNLGLYNGKCLAISTFSYLCLLESIYYHCINQEEYLDILKNCLIDSFKIDIKKIMRPIRQLNLFRKLCELGKTTHTNNLPFFNLFWMIDDCLFSVIEHVVNYAFFILFQAQD